MLSTGPTNESNGANKKGDTEKTDKNFSNEPLCRQEHVALGCWSSLFFFQGIQCTAPAKKDPPNPMQKPKCAGTLSIRIFFFLLECVQKIKIANKDEVK